MRGGKRDRERRRGVHFLVSMEIFFKTVSTVLLNVVDMYRYNK